MAEDQGVNDLMPGLLSVVLLQKMVFFNKLNKVKATLSHLMLS